MSKKKKKRSTWDDEQTLTKKKRNIWISHTKFSTGDKVIEHNIAYARNSFIQHFKIRQKQ